MAYTLEEIYEALGKVENGAGMVKDLKDAITKTRNEAATSRINKNKVLDALGLRDDENSLAGLTATLTALKQFGTPEGLGKELNALQEQVKELAGKYEESEKKAALEKEKRIAEAIESQLLTALTENKAVSPKNFIKLLKDEVTVKENGEFLFKSGGKEVAIADGVKNWLNENKWAVKNTIPKGANSNGGADGGKKYSMSELQNMSRDEINANWAEIQKGVAE